MGFALWDAALLKAVVRGLGELWIDLSLVSATIALRSCSCSLSPTVVLALRRSLGGVLELAEPSTSL